MGNFEKPLTWGLVILLLGYLFVANCECGESSTDTLNLMFEGKIESQETDVLDNDAEAETVVVRVTKDDGDTIDSVITYVDSTEVEEEIEVVKVEDSE